VFRPYSRLPRSILRILIRADYAAYNALPYLLRGLGVASAGRQHLSDPAIEIILSKWWCCLHVATSLSNRHVTSGVQVTAVSLTTSTVLHLALGGSNLLSRLPVDHRWERGLWSAKSLPRRILC
jgi:hypothetical protein